MSEIHAKSRPVFENLNTSFTNLAALIRYLRGRAFVGRVHVLLAEYEADVLLNGGDPPTIRAIDLARDQNGEGDEALRRLLVRASEPGGLISVFETVPGTEPEMVETATSTFGNRVFDLSQPAGQSPGLLAQESDHHELASITGQLIAAIERAVTGMGLDFPSAFKAVRFELSDDYAFLDPSRSQFEYTGGTVTLQGNTKPPTVAAGIGECLRRTVNRISSGPHERTIRERIALELAILARRRQGPLDDFKLSQQLDRIAGARVL
jgi:hypothetical protein